MTNCQNTTNTLQPSLVFWRLNIFVRKIFHYPCSKYQMRCQISTPMASILQSGTS